MMLNNMHYDEILAKTKILGNYDVLVNDEDEVLIHLIFKVPGETESPKFYYSGGHHGLLMKNNRTVILCDFLHPDTHKIIAARDKILFVESTDGETALAEYEAEINFIEGVDAICERLLADDEKRRQE